MEILRNTVQKIAKHAIEAIDKVDEAELEMMISKIMDASSVFIVGTGRSELIGKAFAMRLMHLGFKVHVVGDVTTPAIRDEDCLIAISDPVKPRLSHWQLRHQGLWVQRWWL
ncbi:MAG: 6-phospho-3-hexuloisomerase [Methanothermobacter sp.]|jgi:6-phospho-3-hexuloisomerase|nr:6-phospho-3-hexuloisomerase [Methanothermobacter sp.]